MQAQCQTYPSLIYLRFFRLLTLEPGKRGRSDRHNLPEPGKSNPAKTSPSLCGPAASSKRIRLIKALDDAF
jgi:hypothetical protein